MRPESHVALTRDLGKRLVSWLWRGSGCVIRSSSHPVPHPAKLGPQQPKQASAPRRRDDTPSLIRHRSQRSSRSHELAKPLVLLTTRTILLTLITCCIAALRCIKTICSAETMAATPSPSLVGHRHSPCPCATLSPTPIKLIKDAVYTNLRLLILPIF